MSEREEYHWDSFVVWCDSQGISLEYKEDWKPWWDCWKAGIDNERKEGVVDIYE